MYWDLPNVIAEIFDYSTDNLQGLVVHEVNYYNYRKAFHSNINCKIVSNGITCIISKTLKWALQLTDPPFILDHKDLSVYSTPSEQRTRSDVMWSAGMVNYCICHVAPLFTKYCSMHIKHSAEWCGAAIILSTVNNDIMLWKRVFVMALSQGKKLHFLLLLMEILREWAISLFSRLRLGYGRTYHQLHEWKCFWQVL